jgi:hypothetical protein
MLPIISGVEVIDQYNNRQNGFGFTVRLVIDEF